MILNYKKFLLALILQSVIYCVLGKNQDQNIGKTENPFSIKIKASISEKASSNHEEKQSAEELKKIVKNGLRRKIPKILKYPNYTKYPKVPILKEPRKKKEFDRDYPKNRSDKTVLSVKNRRLNGPFDRAAIQVHNIGSRGQILLLICRSQCYKERRHIFGWLQKYGLLTSTENNSNHVENEGQNLGQFNYFYYFDKIKSAHFHWEFLKRRRFPVSVYIVAGKPFVYTEKVYEEQLFMPWLLSIWNSTSIEITAGKDIMFLNSLLNEISLCTGERWALLLVNINNEKYCTISHWNNLVRSMTDLGTTADNNKSVVTFARLNYDFSSKKVWTNENTGWDPQPFNQVVIEQRLPNVHLNRQCSELVILQNNAYRRYDGDVIRDNPRVVRHFIKNSINTMCKSVAHKHSSTKQIEEKVDDENLHDWQSILPDLTPIEFQYFAQEGTIDRLKRKPTYAIIGATGGLAVIVLAVSIFWGLNSSSFAVQM